ncbi:glutathione S-transferase family protein [Acinetobacter sp. WZC-1]|uniref:glutathione S-transferase family protein n=1 Tax=Acinetobacter sp. WZC-1 TaxID=3459034 RepID=UPI00403DDE5F
MMDLFIGNKNYSTWSMRPWLVLRHFEIPFSEHLIAFDHFGPDSTFKQKILQINPTGKVPALKFEDLLIWDTLAICEFLAEQFPDRSLWPKDMKQRARARSISAEMHSGFTTLRSICEMNIEADLAEVGAQLWRDHPALQQDVQRIESIWSERPEPEGFLCGPQFSIADAFYAPVVMRFLSYALPVSASSQQYMQHMLQLPAIRQWMDEAKQEHMFVECEEPYRNRPDGPDESSI